MILITQNSQLYFVISVCW